MSGTVSGTVSGAFSPTSILNQAQRFSLKLWAVLAVSSSSRSCFGTRVDPFWHTTWPGGDAGTTAASADAATRCFGEAS